MKKVIFRIFTILIVLIVVNYCSTREVIVHNYIYTGESENWIADYKVEGISQLIKVHDTYKYVSSAESVLTVTYKNDLSELYRVKHLDISYHSNAGGGTLGLYLEDGDSLDHYLQNRGSSDKKVFTIRSRNVNATSFDKDDIIKVEITLDGKTETIELTFKE